MSRVWCAYTEKIKVYEFATYNKPFFPFLTSLINAFFVALDNVLSAKYPKKYLATSMSEDLEGTKVLLRTLQYFIGTFSGTLAQIVR